MLKMMKGMLHCSCLVLFHNTTNFLEDTTSSCAGSHLPVTMLCLFMINRPPSHLTTLH